MHQCHQIQFAIIVGKYHAQRSPGKILQLSGISGVVEVDKGTAIAKNIQIAEHVGAHYAIDSHLPELVGDDELIVVIGEG